MQERWERREHWDKRREDRREGGFEREVGRGRDKEARDEGGKVERREREKGEEGKGEREGKWGGGRESKRGGKAREREGRRREEREGEERGERGSEKAQLNYLEMRVGNLNSKFLRSINSLWHLASSKRNYTLMMEQNKDSYKDSILLISSSEKAIEKSLHYITDTLYSTNIHVHQEVQ